ncbi:MAG: thiamine diphosphokinase [Chloroflexota bacterium]
MTVKHALVLADGAVEPVAEIDRTWPGWSGGVDLVIAADGGARHAGALGVRVDRWVGDGDSIDEADLAHLAEAGVSIDRAAVDKDETDAELALLAAVSAGAERITIVGALGGERLDHELGNVWLLAHPSLGGRDGQLVGGRTRIRLLSPGKTELLGRFGDGVSLLPFGGDVAGITTDGLRYPLRDEPLVIGRSRGLSNVRTQTIAVVEFRAGRLLVVETPARL